jgi:hypothetical protein
MHASVFSKGDCEVHSRGTVIVEVPNDKCSSQCVPKCRKGLLNSLLGHASEVGYGANANPIPCSQGPAFPIRLPSPFQPHSSTHITLRLSREQKCLAFRVGGATRANSRLLGVSCMLRPQGFELDGTDRCARKLWIGVDLENRRNRHDAKSCGTRRC